MKYWRFIELRSPRHGAIGAWDLAEYNSRLGHYLDYGLLETKCFCERNHESIGLAINFMNHKQDEYYAQQRRSVGSS